MTARDPLIEQFLNSNSWGDAGRTYLDPDASKRSYIRLAQSDGQRAILMNAPPEAGEDVRPFAHITSLLLDAGLSAPKIYAQDAENGFLLLEDLGDDLFARLCQSKPEIEHRIYAAATDLLAELHRHKVPSSVAPYDLKTYLREAHLLTDWYLPTATGKAVAASVRAEYDALMTKACQDIRPLQPVLVLRDYHAENLIWLPEREGAARVGLLDYQDALAGHPAYDLVSLLEDARRDTSELLQAEMLARYIETSGVDADSFTAAYSILGAQRNLKIIGIFSRLSQRDGKPHYVDLIPRVWRHLERDLGHPALAELKQWIAKNVPEPDAEILAKLKVHVHGA